MSGESSGGRRRCVRAGLPGRKLAGALESRRERTDSRAAAGSGRDFVRSAEPSFPARLFVSGQRAHHARMVDRTSKDRLKATRDHIAQSKRLMEKSQEHIVSGKAHADSARRHIKDSAEAIKRHLGDAPKRPKA